MAKRVTESIISSTFSARVAEVLGDRHGQEGAFDAREGGLVRGGDDHDGFAPAGFVEVFFEELAHFAAAFADQGDHIDVGFGLAGHHAQEGGFADTAAGEDAEALAAAAGDESVDGLDAGAKHVADALAFERVRRHQFATLHCAGRGSDRGRRAVAQGRR